MKTLVLTAQYNNVGTMQNYQVWKNSSFSLFSGEYHVVAKSWSVMRKTKTEIYFVFYFKSCGLKVETW